MVYGGSLVVEWRAETVSLGLAAGGAHRLHHVGAAGVGGVGFAHFLTAGGATVATRCSAAGRADLHVGGC